MTRKLLNPLHILSVKDIFFFGPLFLISVIFPFVNLFHVLYPAFILGKSLWIVFLLLLLACIMVLNYPAGVQFLPVINFYFCLHPLSLLSFMVCIMSFTALK